MYLILNLTIIDQRPCSLEGNKVEHQKSGIVDNIARKHNEQAGSARKVTILEKIQGTILVLYS